MSHELTAYLSIFFEFKLIQLWPYYQKHVKQIITSDASICSTMAFPPLGNPDHVVSISIDFPSNCQQDVPFHHMACHYSCADWDGLCDHLRDVL